jgi:hypothetical protein
LGARVEALAHRLDDMRATKLRADTLEMDLIERVVTRGDAVIELMPREFRLLEYFLRRPGRIVTRAMLLENVWRYRFVVETNVVDVHISALRRKRSCGAPALLSGPRRQFDVPLGGLFATVQRFELQELGLRLFLRSLGAFDLAGELGDRAFQVFAARHRGARIGRIGEMAGVADPGALFLGGDLAVEIERHAGELGHHRFDLAHAPALFLDLEALQSN